MIYLDNSATTRVCDAAVKAAAACMTEGFFNPSALYMPSMAVEKDMNACRDAILMNEKISEVCLRYVFNDYTVFYKAFRKEFGVSPKEYKEASMTARHIHDNDSR